MKGCFWEIVSIMKTFSKNRGYTVLSVIHSATEVMQCITYTHVHCNSKPVFEGLLHFEVLEGIVLNGVDEGLRYRVDRELG